MDTERRRTILHTIRDEPGVMHRLLSLGLVTIHAAKVVELTDEALAALGEADKRRRKHDGSSSD